jgi:type II secretory pathway pseudopilin PulG
MSYSPSPTRLRRAPARPGFTLGEMLIAIVLFSLVGGSILSLMMRQQRFHRSTTEVIRLQGQLRQASSVLPLDLRGISTADTTANGIGVGARATNYNADIYARTGTSIDVRRIFGSSLICAKPATNTITIYPSALDSVPVLTAWAATPVVGDSLVVLDEGKLIGVEDDSWRVYEVRIVAAAKGSKGCPWKTATDPGAVLYPADTIRTSYRIGLDQNLAPHVRVGAPLRFFRRVRYQSFVAGDGKTYLGYSDCLKTYATAWLCSDPTAVSGPYQAADGIAFTYRDSLGNELTTTDASRLISRIDVVLRGVSTRAITRTGSGTPSTYSDSVLLSIGVRNFR